MSIKKLYVTLSLVLIASFSVLSYYGWELYNQIPPIPERVLSSSGQVLFTGQDIRDGQNVWESIGGQELGSIWGHGAYVAPDWSADWLHRECIWMLNHWSKKTYGKSYDDLSLEKKSGP